MSFSNFLTGSPGKFEQVSMLGKEQMPLWNQLQSAAQGKPTGGAFGQASGYYQDLMSPNSQAFQSFAAPEMRQFKEDIIPQLSEQFAGMGSGGLDSSSFRNAGVRASTDLSERLGALRQQLRAQGAQGLMGLGQQGLSQMYENVYRPPTKGLFDYLAQAGGQAAGAYMGNPASFGGGGGGGFKAQSFGT